MFTTRYPLLYVLRDIVLRLLATLELGYSTSLKTLYPNPRAPKRLV